MYYREAELKALGTDGPAVSFQGPWSMEQQRRVVRLLEAVEARKNLARVPDGEGPAWVCSHYVSPRGAHVYTASRYCLKQIIAANTQFEFHMRLLDLAGIVAVY